MEVAVMKKDLKAWAIKIKERSFYLDPDGTPYLRTTRVEVALRANYIRLYKNIKAEPVRVRVRIEEIVS
jgi:hypothetical protein